MLTRLGLQKALCLTLYAAACLTLGSSCANETSTTGSSAPAVCPDCVPVEPGKGSSSTAGSSPACVLAYLERDVDANEVEALGFFVKDATTLIEEPIDTPMRWVPAASTAGGPASGYERETRVHAQLEVDSYRLYRLDPERCDGTVCVIDGESTEQSLCPDSYVIMHASGHVETQDGALSAEFSTQGINLRRVGQRHDVVVSAATDLSKVRGSLTIDPKVPSPRVGWLSLSLQFPDSEHVAYGVLAVSVNPDWNNLPEDAGPIIPPGLAYYAPIEGQWGEPPTASLAGRL